MHNRSTTHAIGKIVKKFEATRVVTNIKRTVRHRFTRSTENIAIVSENVAENPNVSNPCQSHELGLSYGTLWHIFHLNLHTHPYKVQLTQQLKPADNSQRRRYIEWWLNNRQWMAVFRTYFPSAIKHISHSMGMLINQIVLFGSLFGPKVVDNMHFFIENLSITCIFYRKFVNNMHFL